MFRADCKLIKLLLLRHHSACFLLLKTLPSLNQWLVHLNRKSLQCYLSVTFHWRYLLKAEIPSRLFLKLRPACLTEEQLVFNSFWSLRKLHLFKSSDNNQEHEDSTCFRRHLWTSFSTSDVQDLRFSLEDPVQVNFQHWLFLLFRGFWRVVINPDRFDRIPVRKFSTTSRPPAEVPVGQQTRGFILSVI